MCCKLQVHFFSGKKVLALANQFSNYLLSLFKVDCEALLIPHFL